MNKFTPASNFEIGFSKVDNDEPKPIQKAKYSESLENRGQLELDIENVSTGGLIGDRTAMSRQPFKKDDMLKNTTASKNSPFAIQEQIEDSYDPVLREIFDRLSLSPQLLKSIECTKKSQNNQQHQFRPTIEDSNFKKRIKAIFDTISYRDDYSRALVNALASKYDKFSDELINELATILKMLFDSQKDNPGRGYTDRGEGSILSLSEDIRRYSHVNTVDAEDDLAVLHSMSIELGGRGKFQISGKYLIIDRESSQLTFTEIQIADLSSMTLLKIFSKKKTLGTYTLKDHPDKLFMIEAVGELEDDESKWTSLPAVHLAVYDMPDFDKPVSRIACNEPFKRYEKVTDYGWMSMCCLLCATEHGMLVYRHQVLADCAYTTDMLLCTADSISRVEIDTRIDDIGKSYMSSSCPTAIIVFDGGRQIAYGGSSNDDNTYITIAQVKLSHSEGQWSLSATSISDRLKCDNYMAFAGSYTFRNDKNANAAVDSIVWIQDCSLVTHADGHVVRLTMEPRRLVNSNVEGTPIHIIENDEDFGSLSQLPAANKNKNAAYDILSTDKEVIYCSPENILNISQPGLKLGMTVASENLLMVMIGSLGDRTFLAFFQKLSKSHYELSTVLAVSNQSTFFTLTTDGKYLLKSNDSSVHRYELAIKDPSHDKFMLIDAKSKSQIHIDFELRVADTEIKVIDRKTDEQLFETNIKVLVSDDSLVLIKAWMSEDAKILYVSYRIGSEGFFHVHIIAFTVDDGECHTVDAFSHTQAIDGMAACGDLIVFRTASSQTVSNSMPRTITRLCGVSSGYVVLDGVDVDSVCSMRYEDYGEMRLLLVSGYFKFHNKVISHHHCLFAFKDDKYQVIEIARASEGVFQFVRISQSSLCVVFNLKQIKIFDMTDNYRVTYEKVVTEGVISVAVSKFEKKSGLLAIFTKTELVSIFKISHSSTSEADISQLELKPLYTFDMKFSDISIRASSSFIDPQGYLAITAVTSNGTFTTRIIDYCGGVIRHEVQGDAYPIEYKFYSQSYILAACVLTDSSLKVIVESHYLYRDRDDFVKVISCQDTPTRLTQANRHDALLHMTLSKAINNDHSTGDPVSRLLAIMDRHSPSQLADYAMMFDIVSMANDGALFDAYVGRLTVYYLIERFQALTWTVDGLNIWSRNKVIDVIEAHCQEFGFQHGSIQDQAGRSSAAIRSPVECTFLSSSDWSSCCCRSS